MQRADNRKFHYIYKIIRDDGCYYIGMHSTNDLDDGYFGSGTRLAASVKKHGRDRHRKQILEFLSSRKDLQQRERQLVNETLVNDPMCMNIRLGGDGGFFAVNSRKQNLYGSNGKIGFGGENLKLSRTPQKARERWIQNYETMVSSARENMRKASASANSPQANAKRAETFKKIGHQQGMKNSQFGTCWVTKDGQPRKISADELDDFLAEGYVKGRGRK